MLYFIGGFLYWYSEYAYLRALRQQGGAPGGSVLGPYGAVVGTMGQFFLLPYLIGLVMLYGWVLASVFSLLVAGCVWMLYDERFTPVDWAIGIPVAFWLCMTGYLGG